MAQGNEGKKGGRGKEGAASTRPKLLHPGDRHVVYYFLSSYACLEFPQ